ELPLPAGPSFDIGVSSQVRAWLGGRSNFGFIIGGPRPTATSSSYPQDNDAQMSWYGNFRLRVLYNPAMNPRAPQ
ncbi:MAG TPA: hypothetical protein VMK12_16750, partial [Anaeromyxobacteraceae bacterium]|nr:hypothetical protein [Anaeromyxobacteraceae bacterium]